MQSTYTEALVEVNEILKYTDPSLIAKIPKSFLEFIKNNMSKNYTFSISESDDINNIILKDETQTILALIYRNYFVSKEEKEYLLEIEKNNMQIHDISMKPQNFTETTSEEYNNIFKNNNNNFNNTQETGTSSEAQPTELIEYKEKWYIRFLENLLNKLKK